MFPRCQEGWWSRTVPIMEMVFSPAKLSSWRPRAEAGRTGEHREHCPSAGPRPHGQEARGAAGACSGLSPPAVAAVGRHVLHPTAWEELLRSGAERSGGFPSIRGPEKSSVVTLQHQKGWIVLPVVKCQAPACSDQQEFGAAVKQRELD